MSEHDTRLVILGTAGGPLPSVVRSGISQALVVAGRTYLVDCGSGVTRQLRRARLLSSLHQVFLTHLHSDHTCDYFNLFLLGWPILQWNPPVHVYGPGSAGGAGSLPLDQPGRPVPLLHPDNPSPGLADLTAAHVEANAYDLNIRMREAGRHDLTAMLAIHEIGLPPSLEVQPPDVVAPIMEPLLVAEDDDVRVTATLVQHAPVFPAFAYRFDTAAGSVVVSGDTAPCSNLTRLARGTDVLVHEVYDDRVGPDGAPGAGKDNDEDEGWEDEDQAWEAQRRQHHLHSSHTPLSEVGKVASEAGAGRLVLTHFVPGDDMLPDEEWSKGMDGTFDGEVVVARDLLELTL